MKVSLGSRIFDFLNILLLAIAALLALLPIIFVVSGSLTTAAELAKKGFVLIPTNLSLEAYRYIFSTSTVIRSFFTSVGITVIGTLVNITLTALTAYALSHKDLAYRKVIMSLITFTLIFNGGMIPNYLLIKSMGMINTFAALIIPVSISTWNLIVLKNFFQEIPNEIKEAAQIDGYNDLQIFIKIIIPISAPAIATFSLFYAVAHWNSFFNAIIYLNDAKKWPIQVVLRMIVMLAQQVGSLNLSTDDVVPPSESVKMAVIVMATVPIISVYPFLQKYFMKGLMVGSIKG